MKSKLLLLLLATVLGVAEGLRCYTYRSIHKDCSKFVQSKVQCETADGKGFGHCTETKKGPKCDIIPGPSPAFCQWFPGLMYGGYCAASLESPFSLSTRSKNLSDVVLLTCPPDIFRSDTGKMSSAICYRTLEVYSVGSLTGVDTYSAKGQAASMMEDSIAVHDLVAGCGVFGMKEGSCVKTHG